jgi:benzodiazapine receptor
LVGLILSKYHSTLTWNSLWLAPYFIWLLIATSLNAYICLKN